MSKKSDNSLLKNVAGIAGILLVFVFILRLALAPLYQDMDRMQEMQEQQLASGNGGGSGGDSGGGSGGGSQENINVDLGGIGSWVNWALGWAWGGPGWYGGPDHGWWGANVWHGWNNWWNGAPDNRVWNDNRQYDRNSWNGGGRQDWNHSNGGGGGYRHEGGGERHDGGDRERQGGDHGGGHHGGGGHR